MAAPQGQLESAYDPTLCPLKPYPEMTDSGLKWLGDVPAHWQIRRLKSVVHQVSEQAGILQEGMPYVALENVESWTGRVTPNCAETTESQLKCFESGDVLFGKLRPYLAKVTRMNSRGQCVGEFLVLRVTDQISGHFLEHLLRSKSVIDWINSSTFGARMPRADWQFVGNTRLAVPPLPEQTAITRFLDHTTSKIERYIRAKQKLILLLKEQKQTIIHQAVTGQIDVRTGQPYPAYKPSRVECLEEIPEHWDVSRVKHAAKVLRGKFTHRPRNDPKLYDGPYPFIQTGDVARVEKEITGYTQTLNQRGLEVSQLFPSGTLVMTIAANIGDVALLDFEACFPDSVVGFFPRENVDRDYLYRVFQAKKSELIREAPVNTQGNLNVDRIGSRAIPVPSLPEQIAITSYLDSTIEDITTTIDLANREMNLFREYRTRLIADVVTGKLDVREAAAKLPQINPEIHDDGMNSILSEHHSLNTRHDNEQEARP